MAGVPFRLHRWPFRPLPDLGSVVRVPGHDAALGDLLAAFDAGDDGAILTGDPGTGKTLLLHRVLDALPDDANRWLLPTAKYAKPADLYQAICFDLGRDWLGRSESELRLTVTEQLLGELANDRRTVLAIDDAQHLHADVLEELRLLANVAKPGQRALFTLLVGLPDLRDRLATPWLAAAAQRYRIASVLHPLTATETTTYLWQQLELAGSRDPESLLGHEAAGLIAQASGGNSRLIHHVATTAMTLAAAGESDEIDCEAVLEAAERLGLTIEHEATESDQPLKSERPAESGRRLLPIPGPTPEPIPIRPPKQRQARRQSA
jgi:type II secretory pathway predicted ATPase ExeA